MKLWRKYITWHFILIEPIINFSNSYRNRISSSNLPECIKSIKFKDKFLLSFPFLWLIFRFFHLFYLHTLIFFNSFMFLHSIIYKQFLLLLVLLQFPRIYFNFFSLCLFAFCVCVCVSEEDKKILISMA